VSAIYRVRQFFQAAGAWVQPRRAGEAAAQGYLPPAAARLFQAMPRYDRRHALRVVRTLEERGHADKELLAAALLHDAGKTAEPSGRLRLWHRVAVVLIEAAQPGLLARIALDRPGSWRRLFFVQCHHAAIGAELARQAGCSPRTVELVRRHEEPCTQPGDPVLEALQAADAEN
jgi:putative nucleotidyltransferase with HDIG domain